MGPGNLAGTSGDGLSHMSLDLQTSISLAVFTLAVAGCLLLLSWLHQRGNQALAQWGIAFFLAAIGIALIGARGRIPDVWSIAAANALIAAAYGIMWKGVRAFEGRSSRPALVYAGAVVWLLACAIPAFFATGFARSLLITAIGMAYSLIAAYELWRGRGERLTSRWPLIVILVVHAATLPLRIPLFASLNGGTPADPTLLGAVVFETLLFCICGVYLLGSLSKERVALQHEHTSLLDPLTGVANRRAFLSQGSRLIERTDTAGQPAALLLFDLDRFKAVNDRYGHAVGDDVLVAFCRVATASIRRNDLFARLGGEEFGCLLPGTPGTAALAIAEQIRAGFAAIEHASGETRFTATVSVGIAGTERRNIKLATLMVAADRALYRAKQDGRNRVAAAILAPPFMGSRRHGSLVADARGAASAGDRTPRGTKAGAVSR